MIKDSEIVTKAFLKKELSENKIQTLREVRVMIYESLETIKVYFEEQTNRHLVALTQGFEDKLLVYKDQMLTHTDKLKEHEHRIGVLEKR